MLQLSLSSRYEYVLAQAVGGVSPGSPLFVIEQLLLFRKSITTSIQPSLFLFWDSKTSFLGKGKQKTLLGKTRLRSKVSLDINKYSVCKNSILHGRFK